MNTIKVTTQEEYDALPDKFETFTLIEVDAIEEMSITKKGTNCDIDLKGTTIVKALSVNVREMRESSQVGVMWGSSQVGVMRESSQVGVMRESSQVGVMWESSQVGVMRESSQVGVMWGSSQVGVMWGSSQVRVMRESSQVGVMRESSQVRVMQESSQVREMWGSSQVRVMWESSQVGDVFENATLKACSENVTIKRLKHYSVLVCVDVKARVERKDKTSHVVATKTMTHTFKTFAEMCDGDGKKVTLYKVVREDYTDHYTGKIKYEIGKTVTCPDWDPDPNRQCGGALHLSPTAGAALGYHKGRVLKCEVPLMGSDGKPNVVVYESDITKVRCREVKVVEEEI